MPTIPTFGFVPTNLVQILFDPFLVTSVGINTMPVASATGVKITGSANSTLGYMKISPDGKKIGYANWTFDTCCIADFNIATGRLTMFGAFM